MRLLVVTAYYPFPPLTGNALVAYNSMQYLSKRHALDLVCVQPAAPVDRSQFIDNVTFVPQGRSSRIGRWTRHLWYLLADVPTDMSRTTFRRMHEKVRDAVRRGEYDAVLLFDMSAIAYCHPSFYGRLVVNVEDPQSIRLKRMAQLPIWSRWQKTKLLMLAALARRDESRKLPLMAKVLLLSQADLEDFRAQLCCDNLAQIPYGVAQRDSAEIPSYEDREKAIIYSGSMYHPPNIDGALFFLGEIFPIILRLHPDATFWIVGADPDRRIHAAAVKFGGAVRIMGRVANMADYLKRAAVSVCPIRLRVGVQTKVLEALSWGTPVVTTSAGNRGVAGLSGTHLWVEDDPTLFAERTVALLRGQHWSTVSCQGRRFVTENFSWDRSVAQLEQTLETLASR